MFSDACSIKRRAVTHCHRKVNKVLLKNRGRETSLDGSNEFCNKEIRVRNVALRIVLAFSFFNIKLFTEVNTPHYRQHQDTIFLIMMNSGKSVKNVQYY